MTRGGIFTVPKTAVGTVISLYSGGRREGDTFSAFHWRTKPAVLFWKEYGRYAGRGG